MNRPARTLISMLLLFCSWALAGTSGVSKATAQGPLEEVAVLSTPYGEIVWRFLPLAAPQHVAYVKRLIASGFYDGTTFHRVIPHFVAQGGDPNSKDGDRRNDGEGEGDRRLPAEFSSTLHYRPGAVGMARDSDPDSGSCQFFIALENLPRLDGRYTIFAELIAGLDVARKIADRPRDLNDNPLERIAVRARLEKRAVPATSTLSESGPSGELLTGPDKPKFFDPGNLHWTAPRFAAASPAATDSTRLDLAVDADGKVIDVRFYSTDALNPDLLMARAKGWRFQPALWDGKPQAVRFGIDADGGSPGPLLGAGAPRALEPEIAAPVVDVRVDLVAGQPLPPSKTKLRLTIDVSGAVTAASVQASCGDPRLDEQAAAAALLLLFSPATLREAGRDPEPISVYLDAMARFVAANSAH